MWGWGYDHWGVEEEEEAGNGKKGSRVPNWKLDPLIERLYTQPL